MANAPITYRSIRGVDDHLLGSGWYIGCLRGPTTLVRTGRSWKKDLQCLLRDFLLDKFLHSGCLSKYFLWSFSRRSTF